jgi:uncharacterized protein YuzE
MKAARYDADADVLYVNLQPGVAATDSELTDDDVIIRYAGQDVVGITIIGAQQRLAGVAAYVTPALPEEESR